MTARKYAPVCSYPGCPRRHNSRGLCGPHGAMELRGETLRPLQDRTGPIARPPLDRFAEKVALQDDGCLVWTGSMYGNGYGAFFPGGNRASGNVLAHRYAYQSFVGPVPDGLDLDHLCRNRACVMPSHLEPVTRAENVRRAAAVKTHCIHGHPFDEANTIPVPGTAQRKCRACRTARDRSRAGAKNFKRRAVRAAQRNARITQEV